MTQNNVDTLLSYWKTDKTNESLICDLFISCLHNQEFNLIAEVYTEINFNLIHTSAVHAQIVEALLFSGHQETAKEHTFLHQDSLGDWFFYFSALFYFLDGKFKDCIDVLEPLAKCDTLPDSCVTLFARAHYLLNDLESAIFTLKNNLSQNPTSELLGLLSMCLLDTNNFSESAEFADKALAIQENQLDALIAKASIELTSFNIDSASFYVDKALKTNPSIGRVWSLAGQLELYKMNYHEASDTFDKAIDLMPEHIGTFHLSAWTALILNDLDKAEFRFKQALELNPNFADSHAGLAIISLNRNDLENALILIKKSKRLDPNNFTMRYAESLVAAKNGEDEKAKSIIEGILATKTPNLDTSNQVLLAEALYKAGFVPEEKNEH